MKTFVILAALIAAPLAAHAAPADTQPIQVSTAGLDLSNPADAAIMIQRIEAAVRPGCLAPNLNHHHTTGACIRKVTRKAVKTLRIPELNSALRRHFSPTGQRAQG